MNLAEHDIQFPHWAGLGVIRGRLTRTPPDTAITINVGRKDSARIVLAKICQEYGSGMYFTLNSTKNSRNELVFETNPSLYELSLLENASQVPKPPRLGPIVKNEIKNLPEFFDKRSRQSRLVFNIAK